MGLFDFFNQPTTGATQEESNTQAETDCAWCLEEQGTLESTAVEDNSHGICEPHSNQIRYNHHVRRFDRVPSYAARYRDGQQAYWGEEE